MRREALTQFEKVTAADPNAGVLVAFFLPPEVAEQIALPGGEPTSKLHLTLAYLGKAEGLDLNKLEEGLALWAKREIPLAGKISGVGRFSETGEPGQHAFYASFDAPGLPRFRQNLVSELEWMGCPANQEHGYTPHITLQYLEAAAPSPLESIDPAILVTFDTVTLAVGDRRVEYVLTGAPVEKSQPAGGFSFFAKINQVKEEERVVYGIASTETPDEQAGIWEGKRYEGDIVAIEAIEKALPDYLRWANIREMHKDSAVGTAIEAEVKDRQFHLGAKVVDEPAWLKVKESVYRGFSIGGKVVKAILVEMGGKVYRKILELKLYEISLVDRPANSDAAILLWKYQQEESPMPEEKVKKEGQETAAEETPAEGGAEKPKPSKDVKIIQMLQQLRDECEQNKDLAGAGRYSQAIALMIGEPEAEQAEEEVAEAGLQMGQPAGDVKKGAEVAKVQPVTAEDLAKSLLPTFDAINKRLEVLEQIEQRLANIEAQPAPGGPVLRGVNKSITGQGSQPAQPEGEQVTQKSVAELRRLSTTEPNPILKAEYARQLVVAEQALVKRQ
jgi:2'-5' RNA ligase